MADDGLLDLELYIGLGDFFDELRHAGSPLGRMQVADRWFRDEEPLESLDFEYVMHGIVRLAGDSIKGGGFEERSRDPRLDRLVWTFHRAWVDQYGSGSTLPLDDR